MVTGTPWVHGTESCATHYIGSTCPPAPQCVFFPPPVFPSDSFKVDSSDWRRMPDFHMSCVAFLLSLGGEGIEGRRGRGMSVRPQA